MKHTHLLHPITGRTNKQKKQCRYSLGGQPQKLNEWKKRKKAQGRVWQGGVVPREGGDLRDEWEGQRRAVCLYVLCSWIDESQCRPRLYLTGWLTAYLHIILWLTVLTCSNTSLNRGGRGSCRLFLNVTDHLTSCWSNLFHTLAFIWMVALSSQTLDFSALLWFSHSVKCLFFSYLWPFSIDLMQQWLKCRSGQASSTRFVYN